MQPIIEYRLRGDIADIYEEIFRKVTSVTQLRSLRLPTVYRVTRRSCSPSGTPTTARWPL